MGLLPKKRVFFIFNWCVETILLLPHSKKVNPLIVI